MTANAQALVFPGQGSQAPGMGLGFAAEHEEARAVFEEASDTLGFDVVELCRGEDGRLDLTAFTQPALVTAEIAMVRALAARGEISAGLFGGHSLGEYTALVAAGAMPLGVALRLVRLRGQLMQEAVPEGVGAMVAAVARKGLDPDLVRSVADEHGVDVANDNSEKQVVLSGLKEDVEKLKPALKAHKIRCIPLNVSAPFHSRHMVGICEPFAEALDEASAELRPEAARVVVSNYTGGFHTGALEELLEGLVRQIPSTVQWRANMRTLADASSSIVEVGPKAPLSGFFATLGVEVSAITDAGEGSRD